MKSSAQRYKTELCRSYQETGLCKYGDKCQFAHGYDELRSLNRHPKYKTILCRTYHCTGYCKSCPKEKRTEWRTNGLVFQVPMVLGVISCTTNVLRLRPITRFRRRHRLQVTCARPSRPPVRSLRSSLVLTISFSRRSWWRQSNFDLDRSFSPLNRSWLNLFFYLYITSVVCIVHMWLPLCLLRNYYYYYFFSLVAVKSDLVRFETYIAVFDDLKVRLRSIKQTAPRGEREAIRVD